MKHLRKLLALALVLWVVFSMATVVSAATSDADANKGQITVENPLAEQAYTAYKIFDVTYDGNGAYAYTLADGSEWLDVVDEYDGITLTELTDAAGATYHAVKANDDFSAADFAAVLKAAVSGKTGIALTASNGTASASNLPLGYYFVTSSTGALCNLTTTEPSVTIRDKNDMSFDKVDDDESVEVGQPVNYTITTKVPDTTGFTDYTFQIADTMSAGLTFKKDVAIVIGGNPVALDPTYTDTGFTVNIPLLNDEGPLYTAGTEIVLTYSAVVNENAVSKIENNTAVLTYSNDPTDSTSTGTITEEETVYTAKVVINKYDGADQTKATKLDGAQFVLTNAAGKYYFWNETDKKVEWKDTQAQATIVITDDNGAGEFIGLEDGTYSLVEIKAPIGYNKLTDSVSVTVNGANATTADLSSLTATADVANNTGSTLPETGGMGTTMIYVAGGILVAVAAVLLIVKKRMAA